MLEQFTPTLYLKLSAHWISGVLLPSQTSFGEPPLLALGNVKGKRQALAFGSAAQQMQGQEGIELLNGFQHPRTLLANFSVAEKTLQLLFQHLVPKSAFRLAPVVVLHPQEHLEGGLTQVEVRGLYELCRSAGARKVHVWTGRELTSEELRTLQFPDGAGTEWTA
ncbi:rod shape-determining protein [Pseudomonas nitroreducens]|uniref:rod shape-determining protein n=1 Tax=Pseudomonas nitroreducens TaxID=46680 RepID=UPI000A02ED75|nr:rod shape-determining protein [Pseudomonas nitroreducens]MCJ1879867.1 rod shape-determining protein [Pseudomonas nitroreducens]MCJ1895035.1 rod shape-determining protein [Pseudomonas nitroreducens]MDG9857698.1 rod shape-determining protein [Pseudomonas nitroreducens]MDH1076819.1 rod shape-determining protein [Pseudomonas nitroreducens]NMZ61488.1 rod shape-determining protein MreB [Pseudomonas nitroreducens]